MHRAKTRIFLDPGASDYRIAVQDAWAKPIRLLEKICKSYAKAGLEYETEIDSSFDYPVVVVRAWGEPGPSKRRKGHRPRKLRDCAKPITVKRCQKHIEDAENRREYHEWGANAPVPGYTQETQEQWAIRHGNELAVAQADIEFWRDCEVLAGERDRWKPGLKAEDLSDDQELAA